MKYVLLFVETAEFSRELQAMEPADRERAYERVKQWFADHADKITHSTHLLGEQTATTVRLTGGEPVITDGPFVEGKEIVSGYAEIEVSDFDEALRIARAWPACPIVEIRPVDAGPSASEIQSSLAGPSLVQDGGNAARRQPSASEIAHPAAGSSAAPPGGSAARHQP